MKKTLTIGILLILLFLFSMICWAQWNNQSLQESSPQGPDAYSQDSTQDSSNASTWNSTEATSGNSEKVMSSLVVAGAVITVVGVSVTIYVSRVKKRQVLRLQDQIYLAEGKDYRDLLSFFELDDKDLIKANDELVAAGYQIASDQDAVDYIMALMRKLAERSQKTPHQLSVL
jgi:hypothetical protein